MKIVFLSNFMNHHQLPLALELDRLTDGQFTFIATTPLPNVRKRLGYRDMNHAYRFVLCAYESGESKKAAQALCDTCDVLILGSAPKEMYRNRLRQNKLTFRCSERVYKKPCPWYELPARAVCYFFRYVRWRCLYLLCASGYTAGDYAKTRTFRNKAYQWAYFTEVRQYEEPDARIAEKKPASLLWVGRLIDCKHPEVLVSLAVMLREAGYPFELQIIGDGPLQRGLAASISENRLEGHVHLLGAMPPERVREHMEQAEIFLFTSDREEGWGAVLNEAMNSGCAVVASHSIGAVPVLLRDGENGMIYQNGDLNALCEKVKWLLDHSRERRKIGKQAYATITEQWNAENAAGRLLRLAQAILDGDRRPDLFPDGVCSKALCRRDDWYP